MSERILTDMQHALKVRSYVTELCTTVSSNDPYWLAAADGLCRALRAAREAGLTEVVIRLDEVLP